MTQTPEYIIGGTKVEVAQVWADGWIAWHGGECPVDGDTWVDVKFRDGETVRNVCAGLYSWERETDFMEDCAIISYRVVQPAQSEPEKPRTYGVFGMTSIPQEIAKLNSDGVCIMSDSATVEQFKNALSLCMGELQARNKERDALKAANVELVFQLEKQYEWLTHIKPQVTAPTSVMVGFEQAIQYIGETTKKYKGEK